MKQLARQLSLALDMFLTWLHTYRSDSVEKNKKKQKKNKKKQNKTKKKKNKKKKNGLIACSVNTQSLDSSHQEKRASLRQRIAYMWKGLIKVHIQTGDSYSTQTWVYRLSRVNYL